MWIFPRVRSSLRTHSWCKCRCGDSDVLSIGEIFREMYYRDVPGVFNSTKYWHHLYTRWLTTYLSRYAYYITWRSSWIMTRFLLRDFLACFFRGKDRHRASRWGDRTREKEGNRISWIIRRWKRNVKLPSSGCRFFCSAILRAPDPS